MNESIPKTTSSQLKALGTNAYQIQMFIQEFDNSHKGKTFNIIEQNFIKKFRYQNSLTDNQNNFKSLSEFIEGYKETIQYYETYYEYLENTLDKYQFCKGLKMFFRDLRKSEQKSLKFFMNEIEFHQGFVQQNSMRYQQKLQKMNEVCQNCKENYNKKIFQTIRENVVYPFSDPFKIYNKEKVKFIDLGNEKMMRTIDQGRLEEHRNSFHMGLEEIEFAENKMRKLIKESKQINRDSLEDIFDMFQHKQEMEIESINKERINEMFCDLQNDLNNRANDIEEYVEDLMVFNDRLINYNPNLSNKLEMHVQNQSETVEIELKSNFQKIVKKIYKKVMELIQKRKDTSISVECQVNFSQDSALRQLEKQKKKLALELKQSQEQKRYLTNSMKAENQKLTKQLAIAIEEKIKAGIAKQQAETEKNTAVDQSEQLNKMVSQMQKEIKKFSYLLDKQKRSSRFGKVNSTRGGVEQSSSRFKEQNQSHQDKSVSQQNTLTKEDNMPNEIEEKQSKSSDQQFREELEKHQIQLIKNMASKKLQTRKPFKIPRRSKLTQVITIEETSLQKQLKRISNFATDKNEDPQQNDQKSQQSKDSSSPQKLSAGSSNDLQHLEINQTNEDQNQSQSQKQSAKTITITQKSDQQLKNNSQVSQIVLKNYKSKTFTKLLKKSKQKSDQLGKSFNEISETPQNIQRNLQQLEKIKRMKEIERKLSKLTKNTQEISVKGTAVGFKIEKQVQENIIFSKYKEITSRNKLVNISSVTELQKDDLVKRFGKQSVINASTVTNGRLSIKNLKPSQTKQQLQSTVSIVGKNWDQTIKEIEENQCHMGVQTEQNEDDVLKLMFEMEVQKRKWNDKILTFDAYRFGYDEFVSQLVLLVLKEETNPIRKLNSYKGSSSVLKRSSNYKFTKENLINRAWKQGDKEVRFEKTVNKSHSRTIDERRYFVPKTASEDKKPIIFNNTSSNFYNRTSNLQKNRLLNCVTITDFKNVSKQIFPFQQINNQDSTFQGLRKKGFCTLHHVKTEAGDKSEYDSYTFQEETDQKLPVITQTIGKVRLMNLPSFCKQDAQNLFLSIEIAKVFEEKVFTSTYSSKMSSLIMALEQHEIKYSTQILATLAHIHLTSPTIYDQIKTLLLYPTKVMTSKNLLTSGGQSVEQKESMKENEKWAELSLKKRLAFIIQLHRKCSTIGTNLTKEKAKTLSSKGINQVKTKPKCICEHLVSFRLKIAQVLRNQQGNILQTR